MAKNYTNYRKFYAEYYGIKWDPKKFQVHHIDGDRNTNSIENLVLLPTELHQLFHKPQAHAYSDNNAGQGLRRPSSTEAETGFSVRNYRAIST